MRTFLEHLLSFYIGETTTTNKAEIERNISNVENTYVKHGKQINLITTKFFMPCLSVKSSKHTHTSPFRAGSGLRVTVI